MPNKVFIATSLDGYIATKTGGLGWLDPFSPSESEDFGYSAFTAEIDAILMGRNTFEKVLSFGDWPYQKPVFVASNQLTDTPPNLHEKVTIIRGTPQEMESELKQRGYLSIYLDGGRLITDFLSTGRVDEMIITCVPITLGQGIPLFGETDTVTDWQHQTTNAFDNGLVQNVYTRSKPRTS